jgi:hypothetical protein
MFSKKCPKCSRKISKDYDFCPYCGLDFRPDRFRKKQEDFGMLGDNDFTDFPAQDFGMKMPFGFDGLFNSLLKEVDKQFRQLDKEISEPDQEKKIEKLSKMPNANGFSISISSSNGKAPEIKVKTFGPEFRGMENQFGKAVRTDNEKPIKITNQISDEQAKNLSKLPKKEAQTRVRRLSNKVIYEFDLPGVKNIKDVVINKLENSIEIKAFSKDTVYVKLIPVNLQILDYKLKDGSLFLELKPN